MKRRPEVAAAERVAAVDWQQIAASLDDRGFATTPALLTTEECGSLATLYDRDAAFRSRVVMQRHAFGRGEYKYFDYPLPGIVEALRHKLKSERAEFIRERAERVPGLSGEQRAQVEAMIEKARLEHDISKSLSAGPTAWEANEAPSMMSGCSPVLPVAGSTTTIRALVSRRPNGFTPLKMLLARPSQKLRTL